MEMTASNGFLSVEEVDIVDDARSARPPMRSFPRDDAWICEADINLDQEGQLSAANERGTRDSPACRYWQLKATRYTLNDDVFCLDTCLFQAGYSSFDEGINALCIPSSVHNRHS
jgi:hypothetical protein